MKGLGYAKLSEQLYSETYDLQVSPRRRLVLDVASSGIATVAGDAELQLALNAQDSLLNPGDGFLFDAATLLLTAPNPTFTVNGMSFVVSQKGQIVLFGLGECRATTGQVQVNGSVAFFCVLTPDPALWTLSDFNALMKGATMGSGPLTSANQPLTFKFQFNLTDSGAQLLGGRALVFYRLVRGLQEN